MAISGNTAAQGAPLIALQQLSMTFGGQRALNAISLALMPGKCTAWRVPTAAARVR